jgi:hypothetical protein
MQQPIANLPRPVFVVGAPRSGTSILTWCLGQHPNLLPLEESNWLSKFAIDLGGAYELGTRRGERSQLAALGISAEEFYEQFGLAIHRIVLQHRESLGRLSQLSAIQNPAQVHPAFNLWRHPTDPKTRWVDGTPEYSMAIYGLLKLFPQARFVHIVREARSVIRSMLYFAPDGSPLVAGPREAAEYWLRCVRACLQAEQAFGSGVVCRIRHRDLVDTPKQTLERVLQFLGEPFCDACLEPLQVRINSSNVPPDFTVSESSIPAALLREIDQLSEELQQSDPPQYSPSPEMAAELQRAFAEQVRYRTGLPQELAKRDATIRQLQRELDQRAQWAEHLNEEIARRDALIRNLQRELDQRAAWAQNLNATIAARDHTIAELLARLRSGKNP